MQAIANIQPVRNCTALFTRSEVLFQSKTELSLASVHLFLNSILLLLLLPVLKQLCLKITCLLEPFEMKAVHNRKQKSLYRKLLSSSNFLCGEKLLSNQHFFYAERPILQKSTIPRRRNSSPTRRSAENTKSPLLDFLKKVIICILNCGIILRTLLKYNTSSMAMYSKGSSEKRLLPCIKSIPQRLCFMGFLANEPQ